jgi:YHS domain-containing protein
MVLDPQCNTYVPKSEAIARGGEFFCSEECARLYLAR